jgi:aminoglycoside phosphotransferase (APT) family kinase protein
MDLNPPIDLDALRERLLASAPRYFPELEGPFAVELLRTRELPTSWIHEFAINTATDSRLIVAKVRGTADRYRQGEWARMVPVAPLEDRLRCEFDTINAIHEHFSALSDDRFGSVRAYEIMPDISVMIMAHASAPSLYELASTPAANDMLPIFRNTGAWLREYHSMPPPPHVIDHGLEPGAVANSVKRSTEFLAAEVGSQDFFRNVSARCSSLVPKVLPHTAEPRMAHADFWMGNVLVDDKGRITVIDTPGVWRGSIYNDLSYFLYTLDPPLSPFRSRFGAGRLKIADCRAAFLAGYFGDDVPHAAIALYELQLLLFIWARAASTACFAGPGQLLYRTKLIIKNPLFRRAVSRRLAFAERAAKRSDQASVSAEVSG